MNTKTIISDLGKDIVRCIGDKFSKHEQAFLLHYEDIGERVFSSKDRVLGLFYLHARGQMNKIVSYHLQQVVQNELDGTVEQPTPEFLIAVNAFRSHVHGLFKRMKDLNLL